MKNVYLSQTSIFYDGLPYVYLPYSIGSVWSYANQFDIVRNNYKLKKLLFLRDSVSDVVESLDNPRIFGFSSYLWNENYNLKIAEKVKDKYPDCTIIFGGPSVPENSKRFLLKYPFVDFCIHNEGEASFYSLLKEFESPFPNFDLPNISHLKFGDYFKGEFVRALSLEDIPSPYASGLFDNMLIEHPDLIFNLTLETNRGCPFSCTFCDWGSLTTAKVKKFAFERIKEDLLWAAHNNIEFVQCADANFGIFKQRDTEIVNYIIDLKNQYGYPKSFSTSWNKNMKTDLLKLAKKLVDAGMFRRFTASIQTLNDDSLVAVKRKNLDGSDFLNIIDEAKELGLPVSTEIIMGLPNETYESYLDLLEYLRVKNVPYNYGHLHILKNSEMAKKSYIQEHEFDIIHSVSSYGSEDVKEYEHIVVGTKTLPRDKMLKLYLFQWLMYSFERLKFTDLIADTLNKVYNIKFTEFYNDLLNHILTDTNHLLHKDFIRLSSPLDNDCLAVLDNHPNLKQYDILDKIFYNETFYDDLKKFCINKYGCDSEILEDAILYQLNSFRYKKVDETIKVNFKSNLFNVLNSTDKLLKTPTHFTVFKEKIPTQYPNWFSFIRSKTSWGNFADSRFNEVQLHN